ncbi:MAG: hypothetical protein ACTSRU_19865 [Candidatus Hodarchaeales archaeon]
MSRNIKNGKCEHCGSTKGHWIGNYWDCYNCGSITTYYQITEKGREVLRALLGENNLSEEIKNEG